MSNQPTNDPGAPPDEQDPNPDVEPEPETEDPNVYSDQDAPPRGGPF